jgi:peptidoglycan/xylan/chitin deacetylase (PgdA/CDA1 family)
MNMVVEVLGSRAVSGAVGAVTRRQPRGLAYHQVDDPAAFAAQLDWFARQGYSTITAAQLADAITSGSSLPGKPLWITFDDGDASVVRHALPALRARNMVATAFLCGAWVGGDDVPWWQVVEAAVAERVVREGDLAHSVDIGDLVQVRLALKRSPDTERRRLITEFSGRLAEQGTVLAGAQWSLADLRSWLDSGSDVGNHSWDHPILDQCDATEQRRQVHLAHERLSDLVGRPVDVFAWPNGDSSPAAADALQALGYRLIADCDHRLVARRPDPMRVSRLRLDSSVDLTRTRSIVSGAHSAVFHLERRLRGRGDVHDVT